MINFNDEFNNANTSHSECQNLASLSEGVSLCNCNELQREYRSNELGDEPSKNGNTSLMPDYACIRDSRLMNSIKI